jgi:uncharacterized protein YndB with AHSA1/START domain
MRAVPLIVFSMLASPASAEVVSASANGFHVRETVQMVVPTDRAYAAFARLPNWWNKEHTYSGDSANLSLTMSAGGCFCERLKEGGGVEHMHVSFIDPGKRVVFTGALGPLLFQATAGVMDVQFERIAGGAKVTLDYKAAGFAEGGADKLAPVVDSVLADQMTRYRRFAVGQPRT